METQRWRLILLSLMTIALIGVVALLLLLIMGMNIGICMMAIGFFGYWKVRGFLPALTLFKTIPFTQATTYSFTVIPLFVLMGNLCYYSGMSGDLYDMCHKCSKFNIDFANAFPIDNFNTRWVFRSYSANGCYLVVARNFVALRKAPVLYEDFDLSTLSVKDAEDFFTYITQFNEGFPKYVEHFFKLVEDIEL